MVLGAPFARYPPPPPIGLEKLHIWSSGHYRYGLLQTRYTTESGTVPMLITHFLCLRLLNENLASVDFVPILHDSLAMESNANVQCMPIYLH